MLYPLVRPLLFQMDPETAHSFTMRMLDIAHQLRLDGLYRRKAARSPVQAMGLTFPNPVGLAAGLDKDGTHIDALAALGFGFIEIGTVTPKPQDGNPKPRMFRLPQHRAIINRMGFNNHGVDFLLDNVRNCHFQGVIGINIGKNATTPIERAVDDYLICLDKVYGCASYVAVNISSPNTKNLRQLQGEGELNALLSALKERQKLLADQHSRYVPLAVKIAPDLDDEEIAAIARLLIRHEIDGVIATNTTLARDALGQHPMAQEAGGLSGAPLTRPSTDFIRKLAENLDGALPIIGVGGILNGQDAIDKIEAGATLVQVFSGMVFTGPDLIGDCINTLAAHARATANAPPESKTD